MLWSGAIAAGISSLKSHSLSRLLGALVLGVFPIGLVGMIMLAHIPSGPLVGYFILMLAIAITSKDQS